MKNLTKELKQDSIEKWQEIIANIHAHKKLRGGYTKKYWTPCGFCLAADQTAKDAPINERYKYSACFACDLRNSNESKPFYICHNYFSSVASDVFDYADNGNWAIAESHARLVLRIIRKSHWVQLSRSKVQV